MKRLRITHLAFIGEQLEPVLIRFGSSVTIIHGPSDSGKSAIVNAIDFVLGATELQSFPEIKGYKAVALGMTMPDQQTITFVRNKGSNTISLFKGELSDFPEVEPYKTIAAKHDSTKRSNISRLLLGEIGLDHKKVRKNASNDTRSLSFRDIAKVCIVTETAMQSSNPPGTSGNYATRTTERSVLELLLTGRDDSELVAGSTADENRLQRARLEVLQHVREDLETRLGDGERDSDLYQERDELNNLIAGLTKSINAVLAQRGRQLSLRTKTENDLEKLKVQRADISDLQERFSLLLRQYESDIERLKAMEEAGNLLDFFGQGACIFCGAEPENQHLTMSCEGETADFTTAVLAELTKTSSLRADLLTTIQNMEEKAEHLDGLIRDRTEAMIEIDEELREYELEMTPFRESLDELVEKRAGVDKLLGLFEHWQSVVDMIDEIENEMSDASGEASEPRKALDPAVVKDFSNRLRRRLEKWDYPEADSVRYDASKMEIFAGDQKRSSHGKGVRAILHAAFTVSLAQRCFDKNISHPGFVILDSPLVTYRPPDGLEGRFDSSFNGAISAFYRDLQTDFDGQLIIVENVPPVEPLEADTVEIAFTKQVGKGRYGLFPS